MKRTEEYEKCIGCGDDTNLQMKSGAYICSNCQKAIGRDQKEIQDKSKILYEGRDLKMELLKDITLLELMLSLGCTKTTHCIKALKAIKMYEDILDGSASEEFLKKIQNYVDILEK